MAVIGRLVGQLLRSDSVAVVEYDGKHVEAKNEYNLQGKPNARCIIGSDATEGELPTLLAVTLASDTINVKSAGGS